MAPVIRQASIEETSEYAEFIARLQEFHRRRGTNFEPAPKVGNRRVDLLRLYQRITSEGGYDEVSATKLRWRHIGQELNLGTSNLPSLAFNLKTAYYKNVAAFEIADFHKQEPPPKEILEDVSAKGHGLLHRTLENYQRRLSRDELLANGMDHDASEEDGHLHEDRMEIDDGLSGRRSMAPLFEWSRPTEDNDLRHAPPQRVLFQPEMGSTRHTSGLTNSPAPPVFNMPNGTYGPNGVSQALANYEPKQQYPLSMKPVATPANTPEEFKAKQKKLRDAALGRQKSSRQPPGMMLPGTGFTGPSIYSRTLLALRSGILSEQEYALHHLVKISHERGDKYRFENFVGLAESLLEKTLEVSALLSDVEWTITYQGEGALQAPETLDGVAGTPDILNKIKSVRSLERNNKLESEEFALRVRLISEAGLILRNMVMMEENAKFLSNVPSTRDALVIILKLPRNSVTAEVQQYLLEATEQISKYLAVSPEDPLFEVVMEATESSDRGSILTALRAISRFGWSLREPIPLQTISSSMVQHLCEWMLVGDEELRGACLDFLFRYTTVPENVELLMERTDLEGLMRQLVRLLSHGARTEERRDPQPLAGRPDLVEYPIPRISRDLIDQLLGYDEPERSSQWLRACFEEDDRGEITQISLWQGYQIPFAPFAQQRPLLPAKDFITNVSTTFTNATAQVIPSPQPGIQQPKFVIRGITPRRVPVDPKGRAYLRCLWHLENGEECGEFALWPKVLFEHVVSAHLNVTKDSEGQYDFTQMDGRTYTCNWAGCQKFAAPNRPATPYTVGMHVKTHLPDSSEKYYQRSKHNVTSDAQDQPRPILPPWSLSNTQTDENGKPTGLPYTSLLVLRNIARNLPKTTAGTSPGGEELVSNLFAPLKGQIYLAMAHNISLRDHLPVLANMIEPKPA